jgi:transcriptional regulator with XRE-family HTH domain
MISHESFNLGSVIKTFRKRRKFSQIETSEILEVSQGFLSRVERNKLTPDARQWAILIRALKIPKFVQKMLWRELELRTDRRVEILRKRR